MAAAKNWDKIYYGLGHVLQMKAIIAKWGITPLSSNKATRPQKSLSSSVVIHWPEFDREVYGS